MMGNTESTKWFIVFKNIKDKHDKAYHCIDVAISLEEQEKPNEAIEKYKEGISYIDQALSVQVECPDNPGDTWEKGRHMIQQMKQTRAEVLTRINSIQSNLNTVQEPPSYEEAVANNSSLPNKPLTYEDLAMALRNLSISSDENSSINIIYAHDDVRLYFITPEGEVSSSTDYLTLKIGVLEGVLSDQQTTTFLIVGEWVYPLVPGVSPCYHTEYGAFILPDVHSDRPGSSVGIILPGGEDCGLYEMLEDILHGVVGVRPTIIGEGVDRRKREQPSIPTSFSQRLINGAYYVSQGLINGAMKTGDMINQATPHLLNHIEPAAQPKSVPRKVEKSMEVAQDVTGMAANVTGYISGKVGTATMALGRFLAPHVQKHGTRILAKQFKMSHEQASSTVNSALTLAAGAVESFATVYSGLETSAKVLGRNISDNTVKIVEHKYGHSSGKVAENTMNTLGNVMLTTHNMQMITPKGIAKQSVKATGKAMIEDKREELNPSRPNLYPDLSTPNDDDQLPGPSTSMEKKS